MFFVKPFSIFSFSLGPNSIKELIRVFFFSFFLIKCETSKRELVLWLDEMLEPYSVNMMECLLDIQLD